VNVDVAEAEVQVSLWYVTAIRVDHRGVGDAYCYKYIIHLNGFLYDFFG
jgi:hypothetical protein